MLICEITEPKLVQKPSKTPALTLSQQHTIAAIVLSLLSVLVNQPARGEVVAIEGSGLNGSGVVIAPNKVITNCHLFKDTYTGTIIAKKDLGSPKKYQKSRTEFSGIKALVKGDLCLIQVNTSRFNITPIDESEIQPGDEVTADNMHGTSTGKVKTVHNRKDGLSFIGSSSPWEVGASGGALIRNGKLVGITTYRTFPTSGPPTYWAVSVKSIPELGNLPVTYQTIDIPMYANNTIPHQVDERHFA